MRSNAEHPNSLTILVGAHIEGAKTQEVVAAVVVSDN